MTQISKEITKEILRMSTLGLSAYYISKELKLSSTTVAKYFKINNIALNKPGFQAYYPIDHMFFNVIDTEEKAYFAGLLAADGYTYPQRHRVGIRLAEKDKHLVELLASLISPSKPIPLGFKKAGVADFQGRKINRTASFSILWSSKQMVKDLGSIGITAKKSLTMQAITSKITESVRHHFIRGYLDGDGYVIHSLQERKDRATNTPKRVLKIGFMGTEEFLTDLKMCINTSLRLQVGCIQKTKSEILRLEYSSYKTCIPIRDYLYKDATIFLQRKFDKFECI